MSRGDSGCYVVYDVMMQWTWRIGICTSERSFLARDPVLISDLIDMLQ